LGLVSAPVRDLVEEFGWCLDSAPDLDHLRNLASRSRVVAVMLDARALGMSWDHALESVRKIAPRALPIVCHRFSEDIEWPELVDAGAFHALPVPFDLSEVRQSLGYVSAASLQRHSEKPLSMLQVA